MRNLPDFIRTGGHPKVTETGGFSEIHGNGRFLLLIAYNDRFPEKNGTRGFSNVTETGRFPDFQICISYGKLNYSGFPEETRVGGFSKR